jgi:hypothetical protein
VPAQVRTISGPAPAASPSSRLRLADDGRDDNGGGATTAPPCGYAPNTVDPNDGQGPATGCDGGQDPDGIPYN